MKISTLLLLLFVCIGLISCGKSNAVNGHTMRTAYRSVRMIRDRLPQDNKIEFEVSFWTLKDASKSQDEFLNTVDGKSAWEIIDMGKEVYQQRKATGFKGYEKFNTWEEMIAKYDKERIEQEKQHPKASKDFDSPNTTILYNLRAPQR